MAADALQQEIVLRGPLYRNEINALRIGLTRCLDEGEKLLALDFSYFVYIDCAGRCAGYGGLDALPGHREAGGESGVALNSRPAPRLRG